MPEMSSVMSSPPPLAAAAESRKRRQTKAQNRKGPSSQVLPGAQNNGSTIGILSGTSNRISNAQSRTVKIEKGDSPTVHLNHRPTTFTEARPVGFPNNSFSPAPADLHSSNLDQKSIVVSGTEPSVSKYFDEHGPNDMGNKDGDKRRGKKRQRIGSDGEARTMAEETAGKSKKHEQSSSEHRFCSPQIKVEEQETVDKKRDTKKAPTKKKGKSRSPLPPAPIDLPGLAGSSKEMIGSTATTDTVSNASTSSSAQTARQLAERARAMKEREELTQMRKDKEDMGKRLDTVTGERDQAKQEIEGSRKEVGFKNEIIKSQDKILEDIKETLTCNVCLEFFTDPHTIAPCGHTSCAACLLNWFESPNSLVYMVDRDHGQARNALLGRTRACATCRTPVVGKPMSAYVLNNLIAAVKPRLLETAGTAASQGLSARAQPKEDRATMWDHIFETDPPGNRRWHIDEEDGGIARCNECGNEVEDQECTGCGRYFSDLDPDDLGDSIDIAWNDIIPPPHDHPDYDDWMIQHPDLDDFRADLDGFDDEMSIEDGRVRFDDDRSEGFSGEDSEDDMSDFINDDDEEPSNAGRPLEPPIFNFDNATNRRAGHRGRQAGPGSAVASENSSDEDDTVIHVRPNTRSSQARRPQVISSDEEPGSDQEPVAQPSLPRSGNRRRVVESDEDDEDEIRYVGHARPIFQFPPIHLQNPGAWEEADVSEGEDDLSGDESDGYGHYRDGYYEDSDGEIYSVNEEDGEFSGGDY